MTQQMFARLLTTKILIRAAAIALSLTGVAHAQSANRADAPTTTHTMPVQQGNDYNFMAGGGG